jgi:hypothetical protein
MMAGVDFAGYCCDFKLRRAVERCVEIVSEASRGIPEGLKHEFAEQPWPEIAAIEVLRRARVHRGGPPCRPLRRGLAGSRCCFRSRGAGQERLRTGLLQKHQRRMSHRAGAGRHVFANQRRKHDDETERAWQNPDHRRRLCWLLGGGRGPANSWSPSGRDPGVACAGARNPAAALRGEARDARGRPAAAVAQGRCQLRAWRGDPARHCHQSRDARRRRAPRL